MVERNVPTVHRNDSTAAATSERTATVQARPIAYRPLMDPGQDLRHATGITYGSPAGSGGANALL